MGWTDEPQIYYIVELTKPKYTLHIVTRPGLHQPGGYISIGSMDAFRTRIMKRHAKDRHLRFIFKHKSEYDFEEEFNAKYNAKHPDKEPVDTHTLFKPPCVGETVNHASVWDFYKYIKYDHKKNKFAEGSIHNSPTKKPQKKEPTK